MKLFEKLRQQIFWILDSVKGSPQKKDLLDVEFIIEHWGEQSVNIKLNDYLNDILNYATDNIPYYKDYKGFKSIEDFPVINKSIIKDRETDFCSPLYDKDKLYKQATSGSTGTPFVVYQDSRKRLRGTSDTLFFSMLANYELGTRLYFSRVWEKGSERSWFTCLKQNWRIHDSSNLSDSKLKDFINQLETDSSTKSIIMFASTLTALAKYIVREKIVPKCNVTSFITISEALDPWTKETIENIFNTNVFSRYSNQELGIMGQNPIGSNEFMLNVASFKIELLDLNEDKPVKPGESGRVVVTDLFNKAMPLIRYDTGDVAVLRVKPFKGIKVPVFESVGGRRIDFIQDTLGKMVSPYIVVNPMHAYPEVRQFQFIQETSNEYTMLLNMFDGQSYFRREKELEKTFKSFLGQDAVIRFKFVSEIPVLKSGKRKQVVNNYKSI